MNLIDYLPGFYAGSPEVVSLQAAIQTRAEALRAARDEFMAQLNVQTATWGLDNWEQLLGITKAADSTDYRRSRILSKLRGAGTTTAAMIKNVAESFSNGEVEIIEDPASYSFAVRFTGTFGIPPNMDDLTAAIEEIKPAHLAYSYEYIFRLQSELAAYTHAQLGAYTYETLRGGEMS